MQKSLFALAAAGLTAVTMSVSPAYGDFHHAVSVGVGINVLDRNPSVSIFTSVGQNKEVVVVAGYIFGENALSVSVANRTEKPEDPKIAIEAKVPLSSEETSTLVVKASGEVEENKIEAEATWRLPDLTLRQLAINHENRDLPFRTKVEWIPKDDGTSEFNFKLGYWLYKSEFLEIEATETFKFSPYEGSNQKFDGFSTLRLFRDNVKLEDVTMPVTFYATGTPDDRTWGFYSKPVPVPSGLLGIFAVFPLGIGSVLYRKSRSREILLKAS